MARGRPGHGRRLRRLLRLCDQRLAAHLCHAGGPVLRTGRHLAGRPPDHARRAGDQWPAAARPVGPDPGGEFGRGPHGPADGQVPGAGLVVGTSTSAERRVRLADFGADVAIDSSAPDWVEQVYKATGGEGVDLLIDLVAGPVMIGNLEATKIGGRMVNVGRLGGSRGEFDSDIHSLRRITFVGVTFRTRTTQEVAQVVERATLALGPALNQGLLRQPVDMVFPRDQVAEAFERMARNQHFGKIVLSLGEARGTP
ncbi:zinc-binding dehydrogenase [Oleomonas cavernae]|uniref:zinc-binding dehydrogenase n=1 Tax=Oleomonas cavernae TaxID=2320859 RepID=UPI001F2EC2A7|nr:zinc-binding dehydrogenase [Oleomonas cavernae]